MKAACGKESAGCAHLIVGVGMDMVEIARVEKACERESFLNGAYTEAERRLIAARPKTKRPVMAADNFAVKEAVVKALGTGFFGIRPCEVEALRDKNGAPYVVLHGQAKSLAAQKRIARIHVSISNTDTLAAAFAAAETGREESV